MPAPQELLELIEKFDLHKEDHKRGKYNELQVRNEFITPFFKALGWDVYNEKGYSEAYKDVVVEDSIAAGDTREAPDYCFRIGGTRVFFVEAKKPDINIKGDKKPAYQLRRYGWNAKLPVSILTDFEEFAVYNCRVKPDPSDKAGVARLRYLTYDQYAEQWDELQSLFSPEGVKKGNLDRFHKKTREKRGTVEVDDDFLAQIELWREELAKDLAGRNPELTRQELNYAVQVTIDRIVFLRICEDRGLEPEAQLQGLKNGVDVYAKLKRHLYAADTRYNSGLFYFSESPGHPGSPDNLTPGLKFGDKPLKNILKGLYENPYDFGVIPADILGSIYERFLGKTIVLDADHRARVELKPETRKAGGVYYTPGYIVKYIVENTVGRLVEGMTPDKAAKIKICDPACGSGSFLLGAYEYLLDWHQHYYAGNNPQKWAAMRPARVYESLGGKWLLTIEEKKRILLNSIYGVDKSSEAVEVAKLSLLLKTLEKETKGTLEPYGHRDMRALPDLGGNIKCGNSLVGHDFFDHPASSELTPQERLDVNPFDWDAEFPKIFSGKNPGFDVVIGNPPYVRQEILGRIKEYFKRYQVYHGTADLYAYFIERAFDILKKHGWFSYIVSNKWMRAAYGKPLRKWLKTRRIERIIDFGDSPVFQEVTAYPCIVVAQNSPPAETFKAAQVQSPGYESFSERMDDLSYDIDQAGLDNAAWSLSRGDSRAILQKLKNTGVPLKEYVDGKIYRGVLTGLNQAFVIDEKTRSRLIKEDRNSLDLIKPFLAGRDIKRYMPPGSDKYLILIPNGWTSSHMEKNVEPWKWFKKTYPAIAKHLSAYKQKAQRRYDKGEFWWELRSCDYYEEFEKDKIIVSSIAKNGNYVFDYQCHYSNDKTTIIASTEYFLLGILNSKLSDFFIHLISSTKRGNYYEYKPMYISQLPIRVIDFNNPDDAAGHERMVGLVREMLDLHKQAQAARTEPEQNALKRRIQAVDKRIDALVYELYGLSPEEIKIVEKSLAPQQPVD